MPDQIISIDEYVNNRKMSANDDGVVFKAASAPRSYDPDKRSCMFTMSSQEIDRDMDIVVTRGIDLVNFEKNPIALMNHNPNMVLGTWEDVSKKPKRLDGTVALAAEGTAPHVDMMAGMLGQGIIRAASIGFMPKTLKRREMENGEFVRGYVIEESELYECSIVSIPANAQALAKMASDGNVMAKELIEYTLDTWRKNAEGLIVPRDEFEVAQAEASGNKTTGTLGVSLNKDTVDAAIGEFTEKLEAATDEAFKRLHDAIEVKEVDSSSDDEPSPSPVTDEDDQAGADLAEKTPEITENGLLKALKSLLGIKDPEPPAKADPARVKALANRAKAIRATFEDA